LSLSLLFLSRNFKIIGASYLILVSLANFGRNMCPLTKFEEKLINSSGKNVKVKNFTPRFFKKYFGFEISYKVAKFFILALGFFSAFYLVVILF